MGWFRSDRHATPPRPHAGPESDARPAEHHPRYAELDPDAERRSRLRQRLTQLMLVALFVFGAGAALFGERGWLDRVRLTREHRELEAGVDRQRSRVAALRREVEGLREDPTSRERIAREQLGYVRPGEILFLLPDEPEADGGADRSGSDEGF